MSPISNLALVGAAMAPVSWIFSLFYNKNGKLTVPGYDLPSKGFGLLALVSAVQSSAIAVVVAFSPKYPDPEMHAIALILLAASLIPIFAFSTFSYMFARSSFAKAGIWHGLVGLLLLVASLVTS